MIETMKQEKNNNCHNSGILVTYAAQYSFCVIVLGEAGKAGFGIAMGGYSDSDAVGVCILQLQTEAGQW